MSPKTTPSAAQTRTLSGETRCAPVDDERVCELGLTAGMATRRAAYDGG
ncbi:MAG: hypothetical protein JWO86_7001, partial [Myxococcaceae bacterium]|nr:hypothetical protein [Myxococcaceae bacterium]